MKLADILQDYLTNFPNEDKLFNLAKEQVKKQSDVKLKSRKNFVGHFTAAAFLVSKDTKRVLLLEHKTLKKMLQPGGHMEVFDTDPLATAYRELNEETGIKAEAVQYRCLVPAKLLVPFDIDTHFIPKNTKKEEPDHYHHDMRYLFTVEHEAAVKIDKSESNSYEWTDWQTFIAQPQFKKVASKIEALITIRSA